MCLSKQVIFESLGKQIILNLNRCIFSRILRILPGIYANSLSLETQTSMMFCNSQMQMPKKVEEELKGYGTPFTNALVTSHWEIKAQFPPKAYARMLMFSIPQVSKHLFPSLRSR